MRDMTQQKRDDTRKTHMSVSYTERFSRPATGRRKWTGWDSHERRESQREVSSRQVPDMYFT